MRRLDGLFSAENNLPDSANDFCKSIVQRVFQALLQPHRTRSFKLSTDPFFLEKVRDIVGLYLNPPDTRRCFVSVKNIVENIDVFVAHHNRSHRPFAWKATADSVLEKMRDFDHLFLRCHTKRPTGSEPCQASITSVDGDE